MPPKSEIQNPHLVGDSFFWRGGPAGVLLCHGFTATTAEVRPLAKRLHQAGYTVAGPLLPGHGTTLEDASRWRWPDWAATLEKAYQSLQSECERVVIGGESLGGLLSLYLAAHHPEVQGILAYAPALRLRSPVTPILAPLLAPFIRTFAKPVRTPSAADARWQGYTRNPVSAAAQLLRLQRVVRPLLPAIHQPILVIQGRQDLSVHPDVPKFIAERVSSQVVEVRWMEQSTHCVVLDCELDQVAQQTLDFLNRIGFSDK